MKKTRALFIFYLFFVLMGSNAQESIIKGTTKERGTIQLYSIEDGTPMIAQTIEPKADGSFTCSLNVENPGLFCIGKDRKTFFPFYLKKGDNVSLLITKNGVSLTGKNTLENELLFQWEDKISNLRRRVLSYRSLSASEILPLFEIIKQLEVLKKKKDADIIIPSAIKSTPFGSLLQEKMEADIAYIALIGFESSKKDPYYEDKTLLPAIYVDMINKNPFDSENILQLPHGSDMLAKYTEFETSFGNKREAQDLFSHTALKGEALLKTTADNIASYQKYEEFLASYGKYITTTGQKKRLAEIEKKWASFKPGTPAIDFCLPDPNGKMHKLSDYRGSLVVIDLWATWCAPCKKEMPFMHQLEEELKGEPVVFMAVCLGAAVEIEIWRKMIKEQHMKGLHLFSGSWTKGVALDYRVQGVPRFMVINKDGNIVTVDAPRPSTPELKELIMSQLRPK